MDDNEPYIPFDIRTIKLGDEITRALADKYHSKAEIQLAKDIAGLVIQDTASVDRQGTLVRLKINEHEITDPQVLEKWAAGSLRYSLKSEAKDEQAMREHQEDKLRSRLLSGYASGEDASMIAKEIQEQTSKNQFYRDRYTQFAAFVQTLPQEKRLPAWSSAFPDDWGVDANKDNRITTKEANAFIAGIQKAVENGGDQPLLDKLNLNADERFDKKDVGLMQERLRAVHEHQATPAMTGDIFKQLDSQLEAIKKDMGDKSIALASGLTGQAAPLLPHNKAHPAAKSVP